MIKKNIIKTKKKKIFQPKKKVNKNYLALKIKSTKSKAKCSKKYYKDLKKYKIKDNINNIKIKTKLMRKKIEIKVEVNKNHI